MDIRRNYLTREEGIGNAVSKVYNVDYGKPISAIRFRFRATTNTPGGTALPLLRAIEDLQIVDGSNLIQGADAHIIQGMGYGLGNGLGMIISSENTTAEYAEATCVMYFGRYIGDPDFYLDPALYHNLQIRFQSNLAVGAGYYTTGTLLGTIEVITIESGNNPRQGTFSLKEIVVSTIAANAEVKEDIPTDHPYVLLGIFSEDASNVALHPVPTILNSKLSINNDSYIPFDLRSRDLIFDNVQRYGFFAQLEEELDDLAINMGYGLVMENITLEAHYAVPYGGLFIPFTSRLSNDFFDPGSQNSVKLVNTGGGTGGQARIVLMQKM